MKVWIYCICRNEALLMPYLLRHYGAFCEKMIFYDDHSDDGTRELIKADPKAELRDWAGTSALVDDEFLSLCNSQWKEARGHADWIAWIDADEFLYAPNILELLARYDAEGVNVPRIDGYGMVSKAPPTGQGQIWEEIKTGFYSPEWSKHELFKSTVDMAWHVGRHAMNVASSEVILSNKADIKLLHYRYLGRDYMRSRNGKNIDRQPEYCRKMHFGDNALPEATKPYSYHWFDKIADNTFLNVI